MKSQFKSTWRFIKSIYYASAPSWRILKAGSLILFGFFCWSAANVLVSYGLDGFFWYLLMAYGFLLILFGPLTHLVLLPYGLPWLRRRTRGSLLHTLGKKLTPVTLTIFFGLVTLLAATRADVMTFDFTFARTAQTLADVNPQLDCRKLLDSGKIECSVSSDAGIQSIVVESGHQQLIVDDHQPFSFVIREDQLERVVGQRQLRVVLRDWRADRPPFHAHGFDDSMTTIGPGTPR